MSYSPPPGGDAPVERMVIMTKEQKCEQYGELIYNQGDDIANYIDDQFAISKETYSKKLLDKIKELLSPLPAHYAAQPSHSLLDDNFTLEESGGISLDQTIQDFLNNEFVGSGSMRQDEEYGDMPETYGDMLDDYTNSLGVEIMFSLTLKYLNEKNNLTISTEDWEEVCSDFSYFDEIYSDCVCSDFFVAEAAIKVLGIADMKLSDLIGE